MKYNKNIYQRIHYCVSYMLFALFSFFLYRKLKILYTFQEIVKIKSLKVSYSHKFNSFSFFIFYFILFHLVFTSIYRFLLILFSNHIDILALSLPLEFSNFRAKLSKLSELSSYQSLYKFFFFHNTYTVTFLIILSNYVNFQLCLNLNK